MKALTRIGIFYDGNFFHVASRYYAYHHPRKARISISGLHEFVRARVAHEEQIAPRLCQVVDVHYFRGRFSAEEAEAAGKLFSDRLFDDVLVRQGVTTHYLPMGYFGTEKGIDVWLALEAYELAIRERFDVCCLIAGDSDYVPLVRKLNALGTRVMIVGWDFEYTDLNDRLQRTKTSQVLLDEVTYPVLLSAIIDDETQKDSVAELFMPSPPRGLPETNQRSESRAPPLDGAGLPDVGGASIDAGRSPPGRAGARHTGTIQNLIVRDAENKHFGFIRPTAGGDNVWFGERDLLDVTFATLAKGDPVSYELGTNWQGVCAKDVRRES